jgi:hypothetical protein
MDVDPEELSRLLDVAPCALIVGYSHRPGDRLGTPNAWVLADNERRSTTAPIGNVGNGVDGPILTWASSMRRAGDRLVWVTDGQVTDSNDHPSTALSFECARLVRRHRISMVRTFDDARRVLRGWPPTEPATSFGRVGRELTSAQEGPMGHR